MPANALIATRDILKHLLDMLNQPGAIDPGLAAHVATTLNAALEHETNDTRPSAQRVTVDNKEARSPFGVGSW